MPLPIAINGLGRIGRALLPIAAGRETIEVVAANDVAPAEHLAHLVARDTIHGPFGGVSARDGAISINGLTRVLKSQTGALYRVVAWYHNEWGHAYRLADIVELVAER